jgi:hypothetical protein
MSNFILVQFSGDDAASVLAHVLAGLGESDEGVDNDPEHEVESKTQRVVGFSPNPEPDEETEEEPDETPDD